MSINNTEIRLLLNLWDLGEGQGVVNMGKLLRYASKEKDKATAYKNALQSLIERGEITVSKQKRTEKYSLSDKGFQNLVEGLRSPDFQFEGASVGSRLATTALQLVLQNQGQSVESVPKISSYDEFKVVALETYDQLNRDYNFDNLVPIYRIRRAIGERVTRSQFNDWMLELQSKEIFQFITGRVTDLTPDKEQDSITTELGGLRYYAKLL
ncbi:hypothetical protein [Pseudanabaena sp. UWO310]|uniref:hypothetical protein n=1 Tax=Pseudanabaena sp. UWO310 TaxID=2480795 RepID=UPI001156FDFC|nr:hypothetical protein [Pseudanabaena sp. UWO310]TYQ32099.1 hypothetical protein PseudUWO310_01060 [Pseudanabaena sp. UWO310]